MDKCEFQGAFDYAVQNNLKMMLTCSYLQKFYKENPKEEYKRLIVWLIADDTD